MIMIDSKTIVLTVYLIILNTDITHGLRSGKSSASSFRTFSNVLVRECEFECRSRARCKALNYRRHVFYCILLVEDTTSNGVELAVDPRYIYSEKREWEQKTVHPSCDTTCETSDVCTLVGGAVTCTKEECDTPNTIEGTVRKHGNIRSITSQILLQLECYDSYVQEFKFIKCLCKANGDWLFPSVTCTNLCHMVHGKCFHDSTNRTLAHSWVHPYMTVPMCVAYCRNRGDAFSGTQFAEECWCETKFNFQGLSNNCTANCGGDSSMICGGDWALSTNCVELYFN